ncbi:MAG: hypothetical protein EOO77_32185, partial [Oxalobacteraceae bacterium]
MSAAKPEKDLRSLNATAKEIQRFAENTRKTDSCWHYCSVTVHGYGRMYLSGISVHAHRFALILHSGLPSSPAQMARHKCVNKDCVRPSHLEWGSARDNVLDRYRDGTMRAPRKGSQRSTLGCQSPFQDK